MYKIAVLITCHNRKEKTLSCLNALFNSSSPKQIVSKVFLVDDGSTDGTSEAVSNKFPEVNLIKGNGKLFWNQGMRLAWQHASKLESFDFYLWLNDDTNILEDTIQELLTCYEEALKKTNRPTLIIGACKVSHENNKFSYGGRTDTGPVIPNGKIQNCKYINGNVVLVPQPIFNALGNLSEAYTHTIGDFDYGLRAENAGYECYTTKTYVAICAPNSNIAGWSNPAISLKQRWLLLHSPKGLNIKEYNMFRKKFWGWQWIFFAIRVYARVLLPKLYSKLLKI